MKNEGTFVVYEVAVLVPPEGRLPTCELVRGVLESDALLHTFTQTRRWSVVQLTRAHLLSRPLEGG